MRTYWAEYDGDRESILRFIIRISMAEEPSEITAVAVFNAIHAKWEAEKDRTDQLPAEVVAVDLERGLFNYLAPTGRTIHLVAPNRIQVDFGPKGSKWYASDFEQAFGEPLEAVTDPLDYKRLKAAS